jgi:leader peptidase (prepilin peptidase) / N-methyltransferase
MIALPAVVALAGAVIGATIDARSGFIPNAVTRGTAVAAFALAAPRGVGTAAAGACATGGALLLLYTVTRGRGLGLGDVKLATAIGAGLGPAAGIASLAAAFIAGGAYGAFLLCTRRASKSDAIAFGPFLAAGTALGAAVLG